MGNQIDPHQKKLLSKKLASLGLTKIKDKSIAHNIFSIQDDYSLMYGFYCITFIEYMLSGKTLLDYTNLFYPNDYKKNDKTI